MIPQYMAALVDNKALRAAAPSTTHVNLPYDSHALDQCQSINDDPLQQLFSQADPIPNPVNATIHDLFTQQAAARPHAQAVESWDGSFSYADVDALSKNLALQLVIRHGIGSEDLVPFCMNKSKWVPVAVLGILKAGAACAAFDPTQPRSRLAELTEQINAKVIVTSSDCEHIAHCLAKRAVVADERLSLYSPPPQTLYPTKLLQRRSSPNNAAVVQFSSGSTGTPKAIVVEHVALASSFEAFGGRWKIDQNSRIFQYAANTFDVAIGDLLVPLTRGGCVCIPSEIERRKDLAGCMRRMHVNWTFFTPTLAKSLAPSDVPSLRTLVMGGEAILRQNLTTWADEVNLILAYGMAESSIYCSSTCSTTSVSDSSNIGTPFGGRLWVVDNDLNPIATGEVGEMLIEGPILARGYLGDVARTEAAFIPCPTWLQPRTPYKKLLRTGDYARYLLDGTLQFAGRRDDHLKSRDFSTEISEIEHHVKVSLAKDVEDAVVELIDTEDKYGLKPARLVAVFVPKTLRRPSIATSATVLQITADAVPQLRTAVTYLNGVLPSSTVPTAFVPVDRLPLTVSGKCNRKALRQLLAECDLDEYAVVADNNVDAGAVKEALEVKAASRRGSAFVTSTPVVAGF